MIATVASCIFILIVFILMKDNRNYKPKDIIVPTYPENVRLTVPTKRGTLKITNERYKFPFHTYNKPLLSSNFFRPYESLSSSIAEQRNLESADTPWYSNSIPFVSSVNAFAPFPEVKTAWEKVGIVSQEDKIMNLYRRPIAPLQDLFEYNVQDKDGFIINLKGVQFLEDGDILDDVIGKPGKWIVHDFVKNKYVWI